MPAESFLYLFGIGMLPFQILGVIAYLICRKKNAAGAKLLHRLIPPVTFSIFIAGWWISIKPVNEETLFGPDLLIFLLIFFVLPIGLAVNTLSSLIATFITVRLFND